ncbi:MAG: DUF2269 family protein [Vicinamibacteria bacterium]|nr:DUF2269 family protein [Vicinamibacteria bacterium]
MLPTTLKFLHVLLAITAVGFNLAYGLIIGRARKAGTAELTFALRTVKVMDDYVANPCYVLLLLTGVGMVHTSGYPWALMWIHGSMALLVVALVLGIGFYTPTLRKQIAILDSRGANDPEFVRLSKRGAMLGGILGVIVLVIVALMVYKPV